MKLANRDTRAQVRVPAEWEPHASTWMQWPTRNEANLRPAFTEIINLIQMYEPLHLLTNTESEKFEAEQMLFEIGVPKRNITWHIIPVDNAWMRDNGPVYITDCQLEMYIFNIYQIRLGEPAIPVHTCHRSLCDVSIAAQSVITQDRFHFLSINSGLFI